MIKKLDNPIILLLSFILFFVLVFIIAKNENITNIEIPNQNKQFIIIYDLEIRNWRTYNQLNFIAKSKKISSIMFSNYLYCQNTFIYKIQQNNAIQLYLPYLEIYTNLYYGKSRNLKVKIYNIEKSKIEKPIHINSTYLIIKNKKIKLIKNYIYYNFGDKVVNIYYPEIEIYL